MPKKNILDLKSEGLEIVNYNSFYLRPKFLDDHLREVKYFRQGFWTKTLERIFILEQYVNHIKINEFFHGEIDNLFYDLDIVSKKLNSLGKFGVFLPRIDNEKMIASILYCNDISELTRFCDYVPTTNYNKNEMQLLSEWQKTKSSYFFTLKTKTNENYDNDYEDDNSENHSRQKIIFDAARIGQWLFGEDPRNKIGIVRNMDSKLIKDHTEIFDYIFIAENKKLFIINKGVRYQLINVHVHSKITKKLLRFKYINKILSRVNIGKTSVITLSLSKILSIFNYYQRTKATIIKWSKH